MRYLASIFCLFILLATSAPGIQLLKIPLLFGHFQTHMAEGRSDNFLGFLREHYSGFQHNDQDSDQDNQLPFKTSNGDSFSGLYIPSIFSSSVAKTNDAANVYPTGRTDFTLQDCVTGVFHPPKIA